VLPNLAPVWRDFRNRLCALVVAIAGLVLWADGVDAVLREVGVRDSLVILLEAAWATGSFGALVWFAAFRCPFCGKCFHWTLWTANPVARTCLHCGFQKWRDPHAARALTPR
jgi:hypothetical protein